MRRFKVVNKLYSFSISFFLLINTNFALAAGAVNFVLPPVTADLSTLPPPTEKSDTFITYDKTDYSQNQNIPKVLREISSHPISYKAPKLMPNGDFEVYIARDGHYYISGAVNGFPVGFMVDSGAAFCSIPTRLAINSGISVAIAELVNTADGQISVGKTSGNNIVIGNARIANTHILVIDKLETPLLGAEVLNILDITYSKGVMTIKPIVKNSKLNSSS